MDYPLKPGEQGAGLTPLRGLLASLAVCSGSSVSFLLRKMNQPIQGLEIQARGKRRTEHPTVLTEIALEFTVRGSDIKAEVVQKALDESESRFCPVWAMLKPGTSIRASFRIVPGGE